MERYTIDERKFLEQSDVFIDLALQEFGFQSLNDLPLAAQRRHPSPLPAIPLERSSRLSREERRKLADAFWGPEGVAHFIDLSPPERPYDRHPIFLLAEQLSDDLPLRFPIQHPLEAHMESVRRFGPSDGTRKIYDLPIDDVAARYREQNETSEQFSSHNDGLGYGGCIEAFMLYAESCPLWGGYTYFQNTLRVALQLAIEDPAMFRSMFLPDAITVTRPRGKGAIRVKSPILFLGEFGQPQVFFRVSSGEYVVETRDDPLVLRGYQYLAEHCMPFAPSSTFINFSRRGFGCIVRNNVINHGRTRFMDDPDHGFVRVLSRKWFVSHEKHTEYKHVPGMFVLKKYAAIFPEQFGENVLSGEWHWNAENGCNKKIR
ncbi:TauD/TfdA family dioxygenase [Maricaulis sp. W15]|uniref:TauD/TfdA family dioxygenase n=1 Tax=Maricaulis sp. W15 TaxID=1772333 RepID=UPI000AD348F1|nr:TauD/TfdA family dioxygenase [Maricaulis sp. W15]